jgi:hypothetical protein
MAVTSALAFGMERFDDGQQFGPRNEGFHARKELLPARALLFIRKPGLGKTWLMGHALEFRKPRPTRRQNKSETKN